MKPLKETSMLRAAKGREPLRLNVFAEPNARKSYQRLFEVAKLNFQSIETPRHIAQLLWEA